MATSFTPGLKVAQNITIYKERRLPLKGETLVGKGERVQAQQVVARTNLPGSIYPVNVANSLSITPEELKEAMLKKEGDSVEQGEVIALSRSFFGIFKSEAKAPIKGSIESVSFVTGQVIIQAPPVPVEVQAFVDGQVEEIIPDEGVVVKTNGAYIQGILGIGGERNGKLMMGVNDPDQEFTEAHLKPEMRDRIVVAGSFVGIETLRRAVEMGLAGLVVGGFHDEDLKDLLGYDLGVAITGSEEIGLTLILTEGFGHISMARHTFDLLKSMDGRDASINGATQIRAGVIRPEIIVTRADEQLHEHQEHTGELAVGHMVRLIRNPYFGRIGEVKALPPELTKIDTGARVRVLEVQLESGETVILPRANIERIMD